ncbi:hypothetical protein Ahy_B07g087980 [Arachis hypogaea]|uniref:non-specific serine/threonine protein kinase n=1 Tax=Arachis hypogaea TaxID=3818 RepID=A0A444YDE5_ARAHY|nr:hypothetical protein Ahy_B07g087980 [Arachis hypogaea]
MKIPANATVAVISVLFVFSIIAPSSYALGSGTTLAVTDASSATVCGVVAASQTRRIQCYRRGSGGAIIPVFPDVSFSSISGGRSYFCGLRSGNYSLLCWDTTTTTNATTFESKRLYNNDTVLFENLAVGDSQVCATVVGTGTATCWRTGRSKGSDFSSGSDRFASISSGSGFSCGILKESSRIRCWGSNASVADSIESEFRNVSMLSIVAGGSHLCGLNSTGFLVCKGSNSFGQIEVPHQGVAFEYSGLALGDSHSCAIRRSNGSVFCWGDNGIFNANFTKGVSFEVIVSGSDFICGLTTRNFSVLCWGPGWSNGSDSDSDSDVVGSRIMRRQRSGTSSAKHPDKAEEFTLADLSAATNNFSPENKIGAGSFGIVYRGKLADGREVAIKRGETETGTKMKKFQEKESAFESELAFLSRLHHKHLVRLVGFCDEKDEKLLVYEYMKNGALYDHLHGKNNVDKNSSVLNSWRMRIKIALDASRGIEYLHNYAVPSIIHRDIKSSNILIDATWTARVSDFGLSLMSPESDIDFRPTKAAGTVGYIDPEYYGLNVLTAKSDVYGLGVVLLELLTGKRAIFKIDETSGTPVSIVDFAVPAIKVGELAKILDPRVAPPELNEMEALELVAYTAMHCVNLEGKDRPTMADIVANLERALSLCESSSHGSISSGTISVVSE